MLENFRGFSKTKNLQGQNPKIVKTILITKEFLKMLGATCFATNEDFGFLHENKHNMDESPSFLHYGTPR